MDQITIPGVDESVLRQLRQIASEDGLPLEESLLRLIVQAAQQRKARRLDAVFPAPTD